jgi:hypothetical protein
MMHRHRSPRQLVIDGTAVGVHMIVAMMLVVVLVHRRAWRIGGVLAWGLGSSARTLEETDTDGGNQTT